MKTKVCLLCAEALPTSDFSFLAAGRNGLHPWCRACVKRYNQARYANKIRPTRQVAKVELRYTPLDKTRTQQRADHPGYRAAESVWRKLKKQGCVPPWVSFEDTLPIYEVAAKYGFEVDHIVPLKGKGVRGLHVPWNLQLLTPLENNVKGNRLPAGLGV